MPMPTPDPAAPAPPCIAAIVHDTHGEPDAVLASFAARLLAHGCRVRGLVSVAPAPGGDGRQRVLMDVTDPRQRYPISQALGAAACGCNLDPRGIADASIVLRRALHEPAELAIANRFGTLETQGQGLADEMLALMGAGIPLLTAVNRRYLASWRAFSGGLGRELPAAADALDAWWRTARCARPDAMP